MLRKREIFFAKHFGFQPIETRGFDGLAILRDQAGLEVVISRPIEKFGGGDTPTAGWTTYHIGFPLVSRAAVDRLHAELASAGAEIRFASQEMRGIWPFYCFAPGRILIEVCSH